MARRTRPTITDSLGRTRSATRASWGKVEQLPSGRYRARYVGPDGRQHRGPVTWTTKGDAEAWLNAQRYAIETNRWTPATSTADADAQNERARSLDEYARLWISTRTGRDGAPLRGTTRAEYLRLLDGPLADLGDLPLGAVTPARVRSWFSALVGTGRKTTAARAYGLLRSVMQTAVLDRIVPENPCTIRGAQNATTGRKSPVPTVAELAIIEATMPERYRAMVPIAAWGGLRYGELTELRRCDVLVDDDTIVLRVERAVSRVPGAGFVVGPPKSEAGIRDVALPPQLTPTVLDHLAERVDDGPDALLFPARSGGHLGESSFVKGYYPARAAAGREDLSWHTLRAFAGTRYTQGGATFAEVMHRLGHSTPSAAMRYQRVTGRDAALAARMMGDD
jgi:integrase